MKKVHIILLFISNLIFGQTLKIDVIVPATASNSDNGLRVELKKADGFFNEAIRAVNVSTSYSYAVRGSQGGIGVGVYGNSVSGSGIQGTVGLPISSVFTSPGPGGSSGVFGYAHDNKNGVQGYSISGSGVYGSSANAGNGGYFSSVSGNGIYASSTTGKGVFGYSNGSSGTGFGVYGYAENNNGTGVFGVSDGGIGVQGIGIGSSVGIGGFFSGGYSIITDQGNVGIGISNPNELLDINGRARIRHNFNTSGIWMSNASNGLTLNDGAFYGLETGTAGSERAGIWIGNAWRFYVDRLGKATVGGGISVGGGETIAKVMKRTVLHDLPNIAANTEAYIDIPVAGVSVGDNVIVNSADFIPFIIFRQYVIRVANFVSIYISNEIPIDINPPSMNFYFTIFK